MLKCLSLSLLSFKENSESVGRLPPRNVTNYALLQITSRVICIYLVVQVAAFT